MPERPNSLINTGNSVAEQVDPPVLHHPHCDSGGAWIVCDIRERVEDRDVGLMTTLGKRLVSKIRQLAE